MRHYSLRNVRFPARRDWELEREISARLGLPRSDFRLERILRQAVDTRRHGHPVYDFTLQLSFSGAPPRHPDLAELPPEPSLQGDSLPVSDPHPFIFGMGPAGLFCALGMVENGLQPWLLDRGDALAERSAKVGQFWLQGRLDEDSNVQFGEGGAGAWSDGKLTSRGSDPALRQVFAELIRFGAPEEISWQALPHLGSEGVRAVVKRIREYLLMLGCRFFYRSRLEDLELSGGRVSRVRVNADWHAPQTVVLALGNSARETWQVLARRGLALEPKPFALGLRIEQLQSTINRAVYGSEQWAELLGPASYRLTAPTGFTFCMCPGGHVIAAASESGGVATNGMSFAARRNAFCNSAIVTPVTDKDYGGGLWDGLNLQRSLERSAWRAGYAAPAQTAASFLRGLSDTRKPLASYLPEVYAAELGTLFPPEIAARLRAALTRCGEILPGFCSDATLIAPETRTSSPIRMPRHPRALHSLSAENLYPIGEGSGYSGGIVSSAADGWRLGTRLQLM